MADRLLPDHVERNPVQERVLVDGAGMGGPGAQGFAVVLTGPPDVGGADVREAHHVNAVDLNGDGPDLVPPAHLGLAAAPQTEGHRDVTSRDVVAELLAELHRPRGYEAVLSATGWPYAVVSVLKPPIAKILVPPLWGACISRAACVCTCNRHVNRDGRDLGPLFDRAGDGIEFVT
jgi:hypothetical protein